MKEEADSNHEGAEPQRDQRDLARSDAYDYELPGEQIAAKPADRRDSSRLMILDGEKPTHGRFSDVLELIQPGDLIVVNDVVVMPCRLHARKPTGGKVEIFILNEPPEVGEGTTLVNAFVGSRRPVEAGDPLTIQKIDSAGQLIDGDQGAEDGPVARVLGRDEEGVTRVSIETEELDLVMERFGQLPLPPYIVKRRRKQGDPLWSQVDAERYQTVFATAGRAVAAPTAGLHFTRALVEELQEKGARFSSVTLEVGAGTFRPIRTETLDEHHMHSERYRVGDELVEAWKRTRSEGRRVIAVGTTVVRALEDQMQRFGELRAGQWSTSLFIQPGYAFSGFDALITNFHLPGSTLLVLIAAFAGYRRTMKAYQAAVAEGYRFYSYGDAMFILPQTAESIDEE